MSDSSAGIDGWEISQLKHLPEPFWHARAAIDRYVEIHGTPADLSLSRVLTPCLEKQGPSTYDNKRLLGVLGMCHRIYMKANYTNYMSRFQQAWAPNDMLGGMAGREAQEGAFSFALAQDEAITKNAGLSAALPDVAKFFDSINQTIACIIMIRMGFNIDILRYMVAFYSYIERHLKLYGTFDHPIF